MLADSVAVKSIVPTWIMFAATVSGLDVVIVAVPSPLLV